MKFSIAQYSPDTAVLWASFQTKMLFMRLFHLLLTTLLFASAVYSHPIAAQKPSEQKIVSGTVLLHEKTTPDNKTLLQSLKNNWKVKADSVSVADKTVVFNTAGGITVMIAYLDYPAAFDEIGAAAKLSWLWSGAFEACSGHQAQVVVSVMGPDHRSLDLYKIFTQTAAAVLETSTSPGLFMNSQYLLLSNEYYRSAARNMVQHQTLPLYCWVYFGRPGGGNGFSYGLSEFGLPEMEILDSEHEEAEVHAVLYDAAMSVVKYGTRLRDGQNVSTEEGDKFVVKLVRGKYLEDQEVVRVEY